MTGKQIVLRPNDAVATMPNMYTLVNRYSQEIQRGLPRHLRYEVLRSAINSSVRSKPKLLQCTNQSLANTFIQCALTGLLPDTPAQECHIIPFGNIATWIGGYRGFIKLACQGDDIVYVDSEPVYKGDEFEYERGLHPLLRHVPDGHHSNHNDITHFYAIVRYRDQNIPSPFMVMTRAEVDAIKAKAPGRGEAPWRDHFDRQGCKTVIKRLLGTRVLGSPEMARAIEFDNLADAGKIQPIEDAVTDLTGNTGPPTTTAGLSPTDMKPGDPKAHQGHELQPNETVDTETGEVTTKEPEAEPEPKPKPNEVRRRELMAMQTGPLQALATTLFNNKGHIALFVLALEELTRVSTSAAGGQAQLGPGF
jgi:recombination protein RecT